MSRMEHAGDFLFIAVMQELHMEGINRLAVNKLLLYDPSISFMYEIVHCYDDFSVICKHEDFG